MNMAARKLLGQAIVRYIAGDKEKAAELSSKAQELCDKRQHLQVPVREILIHKGYSIQ
jgi:hypothetical protein